METEIKYDTDPFFKEVVSSAPRQDIQLKTAACRYFYTWYNISDPNLPRYDQFDILEHFKYAPNIMLLKVINEGEYEYRLQGEVIFDLVQKRSKGEIFSSRSELPHLSRLADYLNSVASKRIAIHSYGNMASHDRSHTEFEAFVFPLVDGSNKISHIIGVMSPLE